MAPSPCSASSVICWCWTTPCQRTRDYLGRFHPELILSAIGLTGALLGTSVAHPWAFARSAAGPLINSEEWQAISDQVKSGQEEAVTQYIRLTSLSGFTGAFTKLGLSGLPLATIGLTLFFLRSSRSATPRSWTSPS